MITLKIARVNNYPQVEQPKQIILPKSANELENMLLGMDINKQNNYRYELSDVKTPYHYAKREQQLLLTTAK